MQGTGESGGWDKRVAVEPDPSKVVVPDGYEVGVFVKGLSAPSSATVDGDGNLWVAVAPPLLGSPDEGSSSRPPHVKVFDPQGKLIKEIGKGTFTTVMNEIVLLPRERQDLHPGVRREDLGDRRRQRRAQADRQGSADRRPPQRRRHLQGRLPLLRARAAEQHRLRRSRQPRLDRHPERSVLGQAPRRLPRHAARSGVPRHRPHRPQRQVVRRPADRRLLPVGVAGQARHEDQGDRCPAAARSCGSRWTPPGADGIYPHEKMEVYAMGFRNQSGVAFGPKGSRFENALAVSDNGANDLGNRRVANGAEKIWLVTEKGQDARLPRQGRLPVRRQQALRLDAVPRQPGRPALSATSTSARSRSFRRRSPTASSSTSTARAACR